MATLLIYTLKFFTFNYYTLYMFMGMWIGLQAPEYLPKMIRVIAWVNGIYGLLYIVALRHVEITMPGFVARTCRSSRRRPVRWWSSSDCCASSAISGRSGSSWLLNIVVTLAWQVRSEWSGLASAILTWGLLTGRLGRVVAMGMAGLAVLGMIELADIRLAGRTGEVSLSETLARVIAPINLELAKELSPKAKCHAGTAEWREQWWEQIWRSVHSNADAGSVRAWLRLSPVSLAPEEVGGARQRPSEHRIASSTTPSARRDGSASPCSALLQFAIFRLLLRSYRLTGQPAGLVWWVMGMVMVLVRGRLRNAVSRRSPSTC